MINVIHYPPLKERKSYLDDKLDNPNYILTDRSDNSRYLNCEETWKNQCEGMYGQIPPHQDLTDGMISCSMGHINAYKLCVEKNENQLILEDDAIIVDPKIEERLPKIIENCPDFDMLFIGGAFDHNIAPTVDVFKKDGYRYLKKSSPATNTVCSYVITPKCAKLLLDNLKNFTLPIDFALNFIIRELNIRVYHVIPYLVREGTSIGIYSTSQVRK